jgi:hypothetical protein
MRPRRTYIHVAHRQGAHPHSVRSAQVGATGLLVWLPRFGRAMAGPGGGVGMGTAASDDDGGGDEEDDDDGVGGADERGQGPRYVHAPGPRSGESMVL